MEKSERDGTAGVFTGDRGGTCFEFHGSHGKERYSTDQLFMMYLMLAAVLMKGFTGMSG